MVCWSVSMNNSSMTYWVVAEWPVTRLILICCPSHGFGAGFSCSSSLDETSKMLEPESIPIEVVGPSIALIHIVALDGCTPRKVVPGSCPATGLSHTTSELKVLVSMDPNLSLPCVVSDHWFVSMSASRDSRRKSIWATDWVGLTWYGELEWLWSRMLMSPL